ncbi:7-cyano-7-deazaguanine synthase [Aquisalimonas sp. APHAB1-3]|uniref:7-cyano-7-deazaguanine synthase n=1 Tax=Aquisalimonas sp. APHAB1-3 TaxID=3402080 RepID=UPI003AAC41F1
MPLASDDQSVNLLWTAGWDSTYRLLDLVLVKKKTVHPFYILSTSRESTLLELETMQRIKYLVGEVSSLAYERIRPVVIVSKNDIEEYSDISSKYEKLSSIRPLGKQYETFSRFVEQYGVEGLELGVEHGCGAYYFLKDVVERVFTSDGDQYWRLPLDHRGDLTLFRYYRMPLLFTRKTEMLEASKEFGFAHIMHETWFCHKPKRGKPCGKCYPCWVTMRSGMIERIPANRRVRHHINNVLRPIYYAIVRRRDL